MLKGLGLVFATLVLASLVWLLCSLTGSNFAFNYASNESVGVTATILALNVATATFLVGGLLNIEDKINKIVFDGPRREIKHNIYAMGILFLVNIFIVAALGTKNTHLLHTQIKVNDLLSIGAITVLILYLYLIMEIVSAVFKIKMEKSKKDVAQ